MVLFGFVLPIIISDISYLISYIIGSIAITIILTYLMKINRRTPFGNEMFGKIEGFKKFLELAEKPKLEELVNDNPKYFYNILPYTYALGISDKWIKKFEIMALEPPQWYYSSSLKAKNFSNFVNSTMNSISTSMVSSPSSSGGSGYSGGGSGGGSSGGGSGRWWRKFLVITIIFLKKLNID